MLIVLYKNLRYSLFQRFYDAEDIVTKSSEVVFLFNYFRFAGLPNKLCNDQILLVYRKTWLTSALFCGFAKVQ